MEKKVEQMLPHRRRSHQGDLSSASRFNLKAYSLRSPDSDGGNQSLDDLTPLDDCDVLQMFEDMETAEMLDHLDEEAKAGGTSTNAQTDTAGSPKETDTRLIVDAPSAKETSVKVRTVFRVDMSRNDSNATDDAALADMVDVTLPAELPKQTSCDSSSAQSHRRGDIRRYFQKNSDREFQIACDETAAGPATVEAESPHRSGLQDSTTRQPLQPLTQSTLNWMQSELDIRREFTEPDPDGHQLHRGHQIDFGADDSPRLSIPDLNELVEGVGRETPPTSPRIRPQLSGIRSIVDSTSSSQRPDRLGMLLTPPSDVARGGSGSRRNPPFRSHARHGVSAPRPREGHRSGMPRPATRETQSSPSLTLSTLADRMGDTLANGPNFGHGAPERPDIATSLLSFIGNNSPAVTTQG